MSKIKFIYREIELMKAAAKYIQQCYVETNTLTRQCGLIYDILDEIKPGIDYLYELPDRLLKSELRPALTYMTNEFRVECNRNAVSEFAKEMNDKEFFGILDKLMKLKAVIKAVS